MLTGKTIGELTQLTAVDNGTKFLVESGSATYYSNYSDIIDGFATTGSNTFQGEQTINGDANVRGYLKVNAEGLENVPTNIISGSVQFRDGQVDISGATIIHNSLSLTADWEDNAYVQLSPSGPKNINTSVGLLGISAYGVGIAGAGGTKYMEPTIATLMVSGSMYLEPYDGDGLQTGSALPSGQRGSMAVSGSNLFFHNGTEWKAVTLS